MNKSIKCKYCGSNAISKYGQYKGVQRFWCKVCKRKFTPIDNIHKMKTPKRIIASALSCYYGGQPLDSIQRHLNQQYDTYMSESGIYNWVQRFTKEAIAQARDYKPKVGDVWVADETMIDLGGRKVWYWDIIDVKSRYLLESHISTTRTTKDAQILVRNAEKRAGKVPKVIHTDYLRAYLDGIELAFGADTEHIQGKPFMVGNKNNIIERFHGTLKDRINVFRGFRDMATAQLLTDGWLIHYNFFKEHESLGNVPPAVKMGKTPFMDWADVLDNKQVLPVVTPVTVRRLKAKSRQKKVNRQVKPQPMLKGIR